MLRLSVLAGDSSTALEARRGISRIVILTRAGSNPLQSQSQLQLQLQLRAVQAFLTKVEVESSSLCAFASLLSAPPRGVGGGQSPRRSPLQTPLSPSQLHHLSPRQLPRSRSSSHRRQLLLDFQMSFDITEKDCPCSRCCECHRRFLRPTIFWHWT